MSAQSKFRALVGGLGLVWYFLIVFATRSGLWWLAPLGILMASPVTMLFIAKVIELEARKASGVPLRLKDQAWSFIYGDTFALTFSVACAAMAWRTLPQEGWYVSAWWTSLSAIIGIAAGLGFHAMDAAYYHEHDASDCLGAPSKEAHDLLSAYPVIFGGLVCVGLPLLFHWSAWVAGTVVGILVWCALVVRDTMKQIPPLVMHPRWYPSSWEEVGKK